MAKPNQRNRRNRSRRKDYDHKIHEAENNTCDNKESETKESNSKNDPRWYGADTAMLRDAGSIYFSQIAGLPYHRNAVSGLRNVPNNDMPVIPGIMVFSVAPTIGTALDQSSGINIAAQSTYGFVRHANSGSRNYDPNDLIIYCVAASQFYSYINWLIRVYGTANLYSVENRYFARAIVEAQRVDFDDVIHNLAAFRYGISNLIKKASSFAVPKDMPIFERHAFLYAGYFAESESVKDQLYMFNPSYFYKFGLNNTPSQTTPTYGSGMLKIASPWKSDNYPDWVLYSDSDIDAKYQYGRPGSMATNAYNAYNLLKLTVDEMIDFGNELLDAALYQEDFGIISGDILKAYGRDGIHQLQDIPGDFAIAPTISPDAIKQIRNMTRASYFIDDLGGCVSDIVQNYKGDGLLSLPCLFGINNSTTPWELNDYDPVYQYVLDRMLVTESDQPTPSDIMEMTRLNVGITNGTPISVGGLDLILANGIGDQDMGIYPISSGSEIVTDSWYTTLYYGTNGVGDPRNYPIYPSGPLAARSVAPSSTFKWSPELVSYDSSVGRWTSIRQLENYSTVDPIVVDRLHKIALLYEFGAPSVAKQYGNRS